jgi:DNA-binding NarL/FixJ family response regulator
LGVGRDILAPGSKRKWKGQCEVPGVASILVIEDDPLLLENVISVLETQQHDVQGVATAQDAIDKAAQTPFDLLLTDVRIAGPVDGVEALAGVRKHRPEIRCILMTGFADADVPLRAARLEADDYLLKPFKMQALLRSVQSVLSKETHAPNFLMKLAQVPGQATQAALRWFYDARLQQLEALRENAMKQYFLLVRSKRLTPQQAYQFFCSWEQLELDYLQQQGPPHWNRQIGAYHEWTKGLNSLQVPVESSDTVPRRAFDLLHARVQAGVVTAADLLPAVRLLHVAESRQQSLESYCAYHWLWADQLDQGDPFLGLTIKAYRLVRHRSAPNPAVRLYEAEAEFRRGHTDLILCVPESEQWQNLMSRELKSERARLLQTDFGHHFLLYQSDAMSLKARLPSHGVEFRQAWNIMRPIFVQVAAYHKQRKVCGCFSLRDIDSPPGQPCSLSHFSPTAFAEAHASLNDSSGIIREFNAAPEALHQSEPTAASDQAVLGRLLFEVVHGGRYPEPGLRVHIRMLGEPDSNRAFAPHLARLGPLTQLFYRLAHSDPAQRFSSVDEAISRIDAAVAT